MINQLYAFMVDVGVAVDWDTKLNIVKTDDKLIKHELFLLCRVMISTSSTRTSRSNPRGITTSSSNSRRTMAGATITFVE